MAHGSTAMDNLFDLESLQAVALSDTSFSRDPLLRDFRGLSGRIGIYGGTFDPLQNGHLESALTALEGGQMDMLVFVPAAQNPLKHAPHASDEQRVEMLRQSIVGDPRMFVSPIEVERQGVSYTVETIKEIASVIDPEAELMFIVGSDCLPGLHRWNDIEGLFENCELVALDRPGFGKDDIDSLYQTLPRDIVDRIRDHYIEQSPHSESSTEVRERIASGEDFRDLVPPAVADFIEENDLYS